MRSAFDGRDGSGYLAVTGLCGFAAFIALVIFGVSAGRAPQTVAFGAVIGLASFWLAGLIGFIFGTAPFSRRAFREDSGNQKDALLEVSDWLAKILVGIGLVEIRSIGRTLRNAGTYFGEATELDGGGPLMTAYILVQGACGFWFLYFWSVMRWGRLLATAEFKEAELRKQLVEARVPSSVLEESTKGVKGSGC